MLAGILGAVVLLCLPANGLGHSGGTDSSGGHHCWTNCSSYGYVYGEYHFHNSGGAPYIPPVGGGAQSGSSSSYSQSSQPKRWNIFSTPDGGVRCRYEGRRQRVGCSAVNISKTAWVSSQYYAWTSGGVIPRLGPVLWPGEFWSRDGFECLSNTGKTYAILCFAPNHSTSNEDWFGVSSDFLKAYS